jgi:alpha-amylase
MLTICPYFHVHQPHRVKRYRVFDIGKDPYYFNAEDETDLNNARILRKVANKSYLPTIAVLDELLAKHPEFRFALSFSGTALDQFEAYMPEVLEGFREFRTR